MILRFIGGPRNGMEEESVCAPERVLHRPSREVIVGVLQTGNPWADPPDYIVAYERVSIDFTTGVATYRLSG